MRNHTTHFDGCDCVMDKMQKLEAENARLREALKEIAEKIDCTCGHCVGCDQGFKMIYVAEEALKGEE